MSSLFLQAKADHILRQRTIEANGARLAKRVCVRQLTRKKPEMGMW